MSINYLHNTAHHDNGSKQDCFIHDHAILLSEAINTIRTSLMKVFRKLRVSH